jgi:Aerotolerance regulator N-terminal/von Willebrand factor type A domain
MHEHGLVLVPLVALGFLSPWFLLWGLGVFIPIAIHLWRRHHRQEISWSAMRFLALAIRKRSKRSRFEQWLLFMLRVLAILLLALAVARPAWQTLAANEGATASGQGKLAIVVLDSSYSMNHRGGQESSKEIARREAQKYVSGLSKLDAVCVIEMASPPNAIIPNATFAHDRIEEELLAWKTFDADADLEATLKLIQRVITDNRTRLPDLKGAEVAIFTDLGQNTWSKLDQPTTLQTAKSISDLAAFKVVPCRPKSLDPNIAVRELRLNDAVIQPNLPVALSVELESFFDQTTGPTTVQFVVDGRTEASRSVELTAGQPTTIQFDWTPARSGNYLLEVTVPADGLESDNAQWLSVDVKSQIKILILESIDQASTYLETAIAPVSTSNRGISVRTVNVDKWREVQFADFDIVILCNTRLPDEAGTSDLINYVNSGGALIAWLGSETSSDQYNRLFKQNAETPNSIMPFQMVEPSARLATGIDPLDYSSPIAQPFRDFPESGLLTTPTFQYYKVDQINSATSRVDLAFANSDPFIISANSGLGRSIWITTPPTLNQRDPETSWNSLAAWPSFVPLVQEIINGLGRSASVPRNLRVGQALIGSSSVSSNATITISLPSGQESTIVQQSDRPSSWSFAETYQRGPYRVKTTTDQVGQLFALNVDTQESDPRRFELLELPDILQSNPTPTQSSEGLPSNRVSEYSAWLISILLIVLLGETLLTWFFARGRT